mmetsp:Transcript_13457/g.30513  ORF Transcript_13457/g.30513 Transcript_13457/m.30513 type:complete len:794 (-) Transcript_13457:80-2461(-)
MGDGSQSVDGSGVVGSTFVRSAGLGVQSVGLAYRGMKTSPSSRSTNPFHAVPVYLEHVCRRWDNPFEEKETGTLELDTLHRDKTPSARGRCLVMSDTNWLRRVWHIVVLVLLVYTGTLFPFRLAFLEFGMPEPRTIPEGWDSAEMLVDVLFWLDLVIYFFFSYREEKSGLESFDMPTIALKYLKSHFIVNLLACFPLSVFLGSSNDDARGNLEVNSTLKLGRLQRISRLSRLVRLGKLSNIKMYLDQIYIFRWIFSLRGVRVLNFTVVLFAVVHLLGCGWFLLATFNNDYDATWVGRRGLLENATPLDQWNNACYFILTVFTTVGFGDITAVTNTEIVYAGFTMLAGAVIQSLIVSEMIGIVRSVDKAAQQRKRKKDLIDSFRIHTELTPKDASMIFSSLPDTAMTADYKKEEMRRLIIDGTIPRFQVNKLGEKVYGGKLMKNSFITICRDHRCSLPPRFPLLTALASQLRVYKQGEFAYHSFEHAWSLFLVLAGTFAAVGVPQPNGGIARLFPSATAVLVSALSGDVTKKHTSRSTTSTEKVSAAMYPYQLFGWGSYFGEGEVIDMTPRATSVRCESKEAKVLILPKDEFYRLAEEFPGFAGAWRAAARRREDRRQALLARLTRGLPYEQRAAVTIQHQVRFWAMRQGKGKNTTMNFVSGALATLAMGQATAALPSEEVDVLQDNGSDECLNQQRLSASSSFLAAQADLSTPAGNDDSPRFEGEASKRRRGFRTQHSVRNSVTQLEEDNGRLHREVYMLRREMRDGFAELKACLGILSGLHANHPPVVEFGV